MVAASHGWLRAGARLLGVPLAGRALVAVAGGVVRFPVSGVAAIDARPGLGGLADGSPFVGAPLAAAAVTGGPLAEGDVVVKDSLDVAGTRTGMGLADGGELASRDATIIARLRAAGGRVIAKTVMTELGLDGVGALVPTAPPHNPRAPGHAPGGSSTGTAVAIARGLARWGVGGDGLGSVRIPAAYCGLYGLKPGMGRVPLDGYPSPAPSHDVPGPITRTAADCATLWQVIADEPARALAAAIPACVGIVRQLPASIAAPSVQRAFARALDVLRAGGAAIEEVDVPGADRAPLLGAIGAAHELAQTAYATRALTPAGRLTVALGRAIRAEHAARLAAMRARLTDALARAFERTPLVAMPTSAIPAPALSPALVAGAQDGLLLRAIGAYTPLANVTGAAAIAIPWGEDLRGRPLSIMFVAPAGEESTLLRIALALEVRC